EGGREGRESGAGGREGGAGGREGGNGGRGNGANGGRGNGANGGRGNGANGGRGNGANGGRGNGANGREGGRPNNRPANREPGPLDPDYDNGEDWGEMESWRDQFREEEGMSARERETPREGENAGAGARENTGRNDAPRFDCSARADGPGGAPRMYANPDDCATYFTCNMRRPVLTYCPRGLNFNPRRGGCDDSEPSNCRNVRTQTPNDVFVYQRRLDSENKVSEEEVTL
ncbi:hypothetical protein GE061_011221, partial [Apolygus lucorum]